MKTEILKVKGDWEEVVDDCRSTVGKPALGREPSSAFKRAILISEHSPIRDIAIKWRWANIPHWVGVHWVRHKWEKFVQTQRSDRTGVDRTKLPQDEPQTFVGEANSQHLIDTWRKRLCNQASPETRQYAEDFKIALMNFEPEIADTLVPNCIYRCGCPEMNKCAFFDAFLSYCRDEDPYFSVNDLLDIENRYRIYNGYFLGKKVK